MALNTGQKFGRFALVVLAVTFLLQMFFFTLNPTLFVVASTLLWLVVGMAMWLGFMMVVRDKNTLTYTSSSSSASSTNDFTNGLPEVFVVGSAAQQIQYLRQEEMDRAR